MNNKSADQTPDRQPTDAAPLLLISGSGLTPWVWDEFVDQLPPGTPVGIASRPAGSDASLETYVEHALSAAPAERFTIVGHSLGAIVALAVAASAPERVAGLVAVAGVVPQPPGSFLSAMPLPNRWILGVMMRIAGTRPPAATIRKTLAGGLDSSVADRIINEFEPDSRQVFKAQITRTDLPAHRGYVETSNDLELPAKLQQRFVEALSPDWTATLNTGHLPMLEDPAGLAAAILDFTRTTAP